MLIKTEKGIESVRLKRGKHWTVCLSCGYQALRGNTAKQCHLGGAWYAYGRYDCDKPVVHMPETCKLLGGRCAIGSITSFGVSTASKQGNPSDRAK